MAVLINERTGATVRVAISAANLSRPADLPSANVREGLPATYQRLALPAELAIEAIYAAYPGPDYDPNIEVQAFLDDAASAADRVTLVVEGLPSVQNLMVGSRSASTTPGTTTIRESVALRQVRIIRARFGDVAFPPAAPSLAGGRSAKVDGGQQAPKPTQRRPSALLRLTGGAS
jgi:hypothetical protein